MMFNSIQDQLPRDYWSSETAIVWLDDPARYRYVREHAELTHRPGKRPTDIGTRKLIGYVVVDPRRQSAPRQCGPDDTRRYQRYFWVRITPETAADTFEQPGAPIEAVDPLTVVVGRPGQLTERAWGQQFPSQSNDGAA